MPGCKYYNTRNRPVYIVTNGYDSDLRRTALTALNSTTPLLQQSFGFDNASRLSTVSDGNGNSGTYSYLANSPLVSQIAFEHSGMTRMTTTKQYDHLNRLTAVASTPPAGSVVSFSYGYNSANQRVRDTLADGSYWLYQYDSLGQLTSAHKYWSDETPVAGQQFDYAFDTIGNRTQTKTGGDPHGWNQRVADYTVNDLNQYTSRNVPGYLDILGVSFATNTVTVNGNTAYRKGEYFWDELPLDNSAGALWTNVTVAATGQGSISGNKYVPQTPEQFGYDADGNLTNDGRWAYTWDAENRLTGMKVNRNVGPQYQLSFVYDPEGRRIEKILMLAGVPVSTNIFLYDGWDLIAELGPNDTPIRTYMWGNDLSGSPQGAGGVGGLLEESYYGGSTTTNCFVAYDGNGNVAALVNAADGSIVANYEYGPFGELIRQTGPMATANPFRFSTKYQDDESDLLYYGYRFYDPSTGRWLNRDPLGEQGGENIYYYVGNDPDNQIEFLGLFDCERHRFQFNLGQLLEWIPGEERSTKVAEAWIRWEYTTCKVCCRGNSAIEKRVAFSLGASGEGPTIRPFEEFGFPFLYGQLTFAGSGSEAIMWHPCTRSWSGGGYVNVELGLKFGLDDGTGGDLFSGVDVYGEGGGMAQIGLEGESNYPQAEITFQAEAYARFSITFKVWPFSYSHMWQNQWSTGKEPIIDL